MNSSGPCVSLAVPTESALDTDGMWPDSNMFLDDWTGAHLGLLCCILALTERRWPFSSILSDADDYSIFATPCSLLLPPWSIHPTPHLPRSRATLDHQFSTYFPTCSQFVQCLSIVLSSRYL
eukprot:FR740427.1.p2 GENE.FR740427.1~~FR740427.1.p2  ORF type:complete len:122 (+),score=3.99 FR740427.1:77-442(+)